MKKILFATIILMLVSIQGLSVAKSEQWSETEPDMIYIEKTQYRSREKETTKTASSTLEGWLLYDQQPGEWGAWISNGSTAISESTDREIRTVYHDAVIDVTGYKYTHYRYTNSSGAVYFTYGTGYADSMGFSGYWENKEVSVADRLSTFNIYDGVQSYGKKNDFWFFEEEIKTVVSAAYTEYQYRTRPRTYFYYRLGPWSEWQDEAIVASDSVDVEIRTLYSVDKSKLETGLRLETITAIPMLPKTGCQIQYRGKGNEFNWSSSDDSAVSVSSSGYISAHKAGTALISAETASGDKYRFWVVARDWKGLTLPSYLDRLEEEAFSGGKYEFVDLTVGNVKSIGDRAFANNSYLKLIKANNQVSFGNQVFGNSSNAFLACESEGSITEYAKKEAIPYYVIGAEQGYVAVSSLALDSSSAVIKTGGTIQLVCNAFPENATNQSITWSSDNSTIATVSSNGLVSGISDGIATITASSRSDHSVKAECIVTVEPILVESISLNTLAISLNAGQSQSLTATILPDNAKNKGLRWTSSDNAIATVNENGTVKGVGAGSAIISAFSTDSSGVRAICTVTVKPMFLVDDSMFSTVYVDEITETNATIHANLSLPHTPTIAGYYFGTSMSNMELSATEDSSGLPQNNQLFIWYNLNKWGKYLRPGTTYYYQFYIVYDGITYKSEIRSFITSGTSDVIVNDSMFTTNYVDGITESNAVIHTQVSLPHNPTKAGYYFGTDANNLTLAATEDASSMPSSDPIMIWYDLNKWGKILAAGKTYFYQFYIVYENVTYKTSIRSFSTLGKITFDVNENSVSVNEGNIYKVPFTYTPADATVRWSSSDPFIVSVDQNGNIYGLKGGQAIVTAVVEANGQTKSQEFTVYVNGVVRRIVIIGNDYDETSRNWFSEGKTVVENFLSNLLVGKNVQPTAEEYAISKREPLTTAESMQQCFIRAALQRQQTPQVHFFTNTPKSRIINEIRNAFSEADDNDINIFYFGGHGSKSRKAACTYDDDYLYYSELRNAFAGIRGENVLFLDCCFSGAYIDSGLFSNGRFHILTSTKASEGSNGSFVNYAYTAFGRLLLKGLGWNPDLKAQASSLVADTNGDKKITLRELYQYIDPQLIFETSGQLSTQHSQCYPAVGDDSVIVDWN